MAKKNRTYKLLFITLFFCIMQGTGIDVYAQVPVKPVQQDSIIPRRDPPKARARRHRETINAQDSLNKANQQKLKPSHLTAVDSLSAAKLAITDSLENINKKSLKGINQPIVMSDTVATPPKDLNKKLFIPNSTKATWYAIIFPGGGQIYNRKYWKLPIVYGGFAGCAYALGWNNKMYKDYLQAYQDITDKNIHTNSFEDIFPPNHNYTKDQQINLLKKRKDMFRRYRDLSIFAFIGVYLLSVVDAYVDAELSNFDISPDLSMRIEPVMINDTNNKFQLNSKSVGLQCVLRF